MDKLNSILKEKIKCEIIEKLLRKELSFSELLKSLKVRDHGQLNYHLRVLLENGLIDKGEKYSLTPLGVKMGVYVSQFQLKELYPVSVVCPIVKDEKDRILLVKRAKNPYKGFWAFPGGKIRIGETINDAAKREVKEETGLNIDFKKNLGFVSAIVYKKDKLEFHANLIPVLGFTKDKEIKLNDEHEDYAFASRKKLKGMKIVPANEEIINKINENETYFDELIIKD